MNIDMNGAMKRPKLSLAYAGPRAERSAHNSNLPPSELRRIVAAMIG
jgi:hypothetical protein